MIFRILVQKPYHFSFINEYHLDSPWCASGPQMPGNCPGSHFQAPRHGLHTIPSKNNIFSQSYNIFPKGYQGISSLLPPHSSRSDPKTRGGQLASGGLNQIFVQIYVSCDLTIFGGRRLDDDQKMLSILPLENSDLQILKPKPQNFPGRRRRPGKNTGFPLQITICANFFAPAARDFFG